MPEPIILDRLPSVLPGRRNDSELQCARFCSAEHSVRARTIRETYRSGHPIKRERERRRKKGRENDARTDVPDDPPARGSYRRTCDDARTRVRTHRASPRALARRRGCTHREHSHSALYARKSRRAGTRGSPRSRDDTLADRRRRNSIHRHAGVLPGISPRQTKRRKFLKVARRPRVERIAAFVIAFVILFSFPFLQFTEFSPISALPEPECANKSAEGFASGTRACSADRRKVVR